jgi:hypothetical protein
MLKRVAIVLLAAGLIASAKTYTLTVGNATQIGTTTLKAGEYKVKVEGTQVTLVDQTGHQIETTAKLEPADHKFMDTAVMISTKDGGPKIVEIELGGSSNKVVFE